MATPDGATLETLADIVRRIVSREVYILDEKLALSDDDVDRLAKLALVMQRIRQPVARDPEAPGAEGLSNEQLMKRAV